MSIPITCSCGQALSAPDDTAGGTFYCWSCGRPVPVPGTPRVGGFSTTTPPASPMRYQDTAPLTRKFTYPSGEWERVRSGLMTVNIGAGMFLVLMIVVWGMIVDDKGTGPLAGKSVLLFMLLLLMGGTVTASIGTVTCSNVPDEAGSKGPAALAGLFMVGGAIGTVIMGLIFLGAVFSEKPPELGEGFRTFLTKLMVLGLQGGFLLFMFFQLITALHLGERGIASSIIGLQLVPTAFAAISPIGAPLNPMMATFGGGVGRGIAVADAKTWLNLSLAMLVGMIIWFMVINVMLRTSIEAAERRQMQ